MVSCNHAESLRTVRFLLELGAYPNSVDKEGNSPLHYVVRWMILMRETGSDSPLAELLLEYGAFPGHLNNLKETPGDLWKRLKSELKGKPLISSPPIWTIGTVMTLTWWSARSIRRSGIPYRLLLPKSLRDFVSKH